MKTFNFDEQLKVGDKGEKDFITVHQNDGPVKSKDLKYDFILSNGKRVELKTDTYNVNATPNFFIEILGNTNSGQLGGPWRALADGIDYFVYYYMTNGIFFWFETQKLCTKLSEIIATLNLIPKEIKNTSWSTRGYLIRRELLEDILLKVTQKE